jgi:hypothetical protein
MTKSPPIPWTPTTRRHPCPICHRAGCLVALPDAVVCARVASAVQVAGLGHLHKLRPSAAWAPWRIALAKVVKEHAA